MPGALAFVRFVAKAALNAIGGGLADDFAIEVVPEIARDVRQWWAKDKPSDQLRQELEQVAQLTGEDDQREAEQAVAEVAGDQPADVRAQLTAYVSQVPVPIRRS
jgi:hypothetical protein